MTNVLSTDKQIAIIGALAEGSSISSPLLAVRAVIVQEFRGASAPAEA